MVTQTEIRQFSVLNVSSYPLRRGGQMFLPNEPRIIKNPSAVMWAEVKACVNLVVTPVSESAPMVETSTIEEEPISCPCEGVVQVVSPFGCPYCEKDGGSRIGIFSHVRHAHSDKYEEFHESWRNK